MSGPIVRRYGFPNFDKIFGEKKIEHGVDEESTADGASLPPDLAHSDAPVDANRPESAGTMAPSTEFGNAVE